MPDKPSRSMFVPLLIVGVVVAIGLMVTLAPVVKCSCQSEISIGLSRRIANVAGEEPYCSGCEDTGKVPLLDVWRGEAEETS